MYLEGSVSDPGQDIRDLEWNSTDRDKWQKAKAVLEEYLQR